MDIRYFTFHRELEEHHEEAMEDVLGQHKEDAVISIIDATVENVLSIECQSHSGQFEREL